MSAVSNRVMPRSIALWITLREASRSVRWPKLLQPRPTAETRRPEPPRLRICMNLSCGGWSARRDRIVTRAPRGRKVRGTVAYEPVRPVGQRLRWFAGPRRRRALRRGGHAPHRFFGVACDRLAVGADVVGGGLAPVHVTSTAPDDST